MRAKVINFSPRPVYVDQDADDLALVARCRAGDTRAFEPIVERYQRVLYTIALRMLGNADQANDVAQNAFVKAFQKLDTFDPTRRFFSWIYRILVNECLNARRDGRQHEEIPLELAESGGRSPADLFENAERRRRVQAAILALPLEYREVVVLRHFADLSYEEIGETLDVPAKTVKSRLHTAKARLADLLRGLDARK
jgi:RNA polymerase sigma-70 factor (ECF subfamily)